MRASGLGHRGTRVKTAQRTGRPLCRARGDCHARGRASGPTVHCGVRCVPERRPGDGNPFCLCPFPLPHVPPGPRPVGHSGTGSRTPRQWPRPPTPSANGRPIATGRPTALRPLGLPVRRHRGGGPGVDATTANAVPAATLIYDGNRQTHTRAGGGGFSG